MGDENKINDSGPYSALLHYVLPFVNKKEQYGQDDWYTKKMQGNSSVRLARQEAEFAVSLDCYDQCNSDAKGPITNNLGKSSLLSNIADLFRTVVGACSFGLFGKDPAYGTVGSFGSKSNWQAKDVDCKSGTATIDMHVENQMGAASMTRYSYSAADKTILNNDPLGARGPLGTVQQSWDWEEKITFLPPTGCGNE